MKMKRPSLSRVITYVVLCLWGLTTIYPFLWVILNSFRKKGLILSDSFSLPVGDAFTWENYLTAWERSDFKNAYLNSFVISGSVTIMVVLLAGLAAYGLVRYRFRLRKLLYGLIMAGMMFPVFSTIIPVLASGAMASVRPGTSRAGSARRPTPPSPAWGPSGAPSPSGSSSSPAPATCARGAGTSPFPSNGCLPTT